jgi:hypothetical protein
MNFDDLMTLDAEYVDVAAWDDYVNDFCAEVDVEDGDYESGQESDEYVPDGVLDDMDGDAAWLASAGWGTDEDYGCFGEDY